ncbi:hypothetical protein pb186bvf_016048 [Paramecium bursaria]
MYQNYPQGSRSTIQQRQPGYNPNQFQQQSQIYQPQQQSSVQLQEMRFAVYQDLENILVILAQTQAILDYFKNDESHPMVAVAYNRFITQLNLSNTIHLDQYHIASSDRALQKELASCKQNAKQIFGNLSQQYQGNANLQKLCRFYENKNLAGSNTSSENLPLEPTKTNYQNSINEDVIQKVVQSIGGVDQTYSKIRNGQLVQAPDQYQLAQKMKYFINYKQETNKWKLNTNYNRILEVNKECPIPLLLIKQGMQSLPTPRNKVIKFKGKLQSESINQYLKPCGKVTTLIRLPLSWSISELLRQPLKKISLILHVIRNWNSTKINISTCTYNNHFSLNKLLVFQIRRKK